MRWLHIGVQLTPDIRRHFRAPIGRGRACLLNYALFATVLACELGSQHL